MDKKKGKGVRKRNQQKAGLLLLLTALVLFGGRRTWKEIAEAQLMYAAEAGREKIPGLFEWVFSRYYPAGAIEYRSREKNQRLMEAQKDSSWIDILWNCFPLYRNRRRKETGILTEGMDPAYKNYMDSRQFASEYEALLGWGMEESGQENGQEKAEAPRQEEQKETDEQKEREDGEEKEAVKAGTERVQRGKIYPREQLADYDFMMSHFFSVHPSTTAGRDIMNAEAFLDKDFRLDEGDGQPQILIYHTHSQETYGDYGPENKEATVIEVGNYLTALLKEKGYEVIHDTTPYDIKGGKLDRSKAYTYALEGISGILQENPSIQVVLDIHRDGVREGYHMVEEINGKNTAPVMFFAGMSRTPGGAIEYLPNPNLEDNLAFSFQMQLKAAEYFPGLTRKIYLKGLRYNLHLRPRSALIEVGAQTNTCEEAKNAMEPLAEVLDMVLQGK